MFDDESNVRLYTPAMLAELLNVPVSIIRRWHRRKLIVPVREVRRLPYFDFQEVATARQLAALLAAGASPGAIERKLAELSRYVPDVERPLAQLSVIVQGKQLLLRQGEGLIEPGGQLRFDFDALDQREDVPAEPAPGRPLSRCPATTCCHQVPRRCWNWPRRSRTRGNWSRPPNCIGRCWRRQDRLRKSVFNWPNCCIDSATCPAARERYYMAIELDEDYVEARANLGCVLAETGQLELAVAAFQGALLVPRRVSRCALPSGAHAGRTRTPRHRRTTLAGVPSVGALQSLVGRSAATLGMGAAGIGTVVCRLQRLCAPPSCDQSSRAGHSHCSNYWHSSLDKAMHYLRAWHRGFLKICAISLFW